MQLELSEILLIRDSLKKEIYLNKKLYIDITKEKEELYQDIKNEINELVTLKEKFEKIIDESIEKTKDIELILV